ncbi:hypothetical protein U1Q18_048413 [Sarracenia purpurea var. burkii]
MDGRKNCYSDEHYLPTFFHVREHLLFPLMLDPAGIANWSVTHVDWSEGKWHPRSYKAQDVTNGLLKKYYCKARFLSILYEPSSPTEIFISTCL